MKIGEIESKIPSVTGFIITVALNTKVIEKKSDVTNLATKTAVNVKATEI